MYVLVAKPALDWSETQPLYILAEQTNILKSIRNGKTQQITGQLEDLAWLQISMHAARSAEGKNPPDPLRSDIAYHCSQLRSASIALDATVAKSRTGWCDALHL